LKKGEIPNPQKMKMMFVTSTEGEVTCKGAVLVNPTKPKPERRKNDIEGHIHPSSVGERKSEGIFRLVTGKLV